ncbi:MAG: hypothetical protein JNM17_00620 [Archangium sp.]|nr:hypothetical protein [Archangium sp.]
MRSWAVAAVFAVVSGCTCFVPVGEDAGFGGGSTGGSSGGGIGTTGGGTSGGGTTGGGTTGGGPTGGGPTGGGPTGGGATGGGGGSALEPVVLAGSSDDRVIFLTWDAGQMTPDSWLIRHDRVMLTRISGTARSYDHTAGFPGSLGNFDASASLELSMGIELDWTEPAAMPGPPQDFDVIAEFPDAAVTSNSVFLWLQPPTVVGYAITRADGGVTLSPDASLWFDVDAPSPSLSVTGLVSRAIADDRSSSIALIADASVNAPPLVTTYRIEALASNGSNGSATATGSRSLRVEYQWQRSAADDPSNFSDLQYVHGTEWADFDAVFSEGRYYRVAVRGGGAEFLSPPTREVLVRPIAFLTHVFHDPWLVREDGLAVPLGYAHDPKQLPVASKYFLLWSGPGALLFDGGVVAWLGGPGAVPVSLPPSDQVAVDRQVICVKVDGGVACDPALPSTMDTSSLVDLTMVNQDLVCGHLDDAGIRCISRTVAPIDLGPVLAAWMVDQSILRSWPGGLTNPAYVFPIGSDPLPLEDAGYVGAFFNNMCAIREDGFLRCSRWNDQTLSAGIPISRERIRAGSAMGSTNYASGCVFTENGRVHCRGFPPVTTTPPTPPLISMTQSRQNGLFLDANGRLDSIPARGYWSCPFIAFDDQLVQLSGDNHVSMMRADRSVATDNRSWFEPFAMLSTGYGLLHDGGIVHLRTGTATGPAADAIAGLRSSVDPTPGYCARRAGTWECPNGQTFPGTYDHLTSSSAGMCALSPARKAVCRPPLPEPWASMRFRDIGGSDDWPIALTTVDGKRFNFASGGITTAGGAYDDYVTARSECGIRRDGTAICTGPQRYPWTGR